MVSFRRSVAGVATSTYAQTTARSMENMSPKVLEMSAMLRQAAVQLERHATVLEGEIGAFLAGRAK